jgi:hypothetical protein
MNGETAPALKLSSILDRSHENKWVAIAPDYSRVLAAADTLQGLLTTVSDPAAVFFKVLPFDMSFASSSMAA